MMSLKNLVSSKLQSLAQFLLAGLSELQSALGYSGLWPQCIFGWLL